MLLDLLTTNEKHAFLYIALNMVSIDGVVQYA